MENAFIVGDHVKLKKPRANSRAFYVVMQIANLDTPAVILCKVEDVDKRKVYTLWKRENELELYV